MVEIYVKTNTDYNKNGDITLTPTSCIYKDSEKELVLEHIQDEEGRWKYIEFENVIAAEENKIKKLYRIYNVVKTLNSITAYARPIFYDLIDKVLLDVRPKEKNGQEALDIILADTGFKGHSNILSLNTAYYVRKNIVEALIGDANNAFINRWGGEFYCENFDIYINHKVGSDNGVKVEFGYNLNEIEENINIEDVVTRIIPVGFNGIMLEGESPWIDSPLINKYTHIKSRIVEFSNIKVKEGSDEEGFETIEEARAEMIKQCKLLYENGADKPSINYKIDMINLANTTEYEHLKMLVNVNKGDTVTCYIKHLDIDVKARVIDYEKDLLTGEYISIELGNVIDNFFDNQADIQHKVDNIFNDNGNIKAETLEGAINALQTKFEALRDVAQPQQVRAILFEDRIEDSPSFGCMVLGTAGFEIAGKFKPGTKEWDFRTFGTGQGFVADHIITGVLNAALIKAGTLKSENEKTWINMEDGTFNFADKIKFNNNKFTIALSDGQTLDEWKNEYEQNKNDIDKDIADIQDQLEGVMGDIGGALTDGIIDELEMNIIKDRLVQFNKEKDDITMRYNNLYGNSSLNGIAKINLKAKYDLFILKHNLLVKTINDIIADKKATEAEREAFTAAVKEYNAVIPQLSKAFDEALSCISKNASQSLITITEEKLRTEYKDADKKLEGSITQTAESLRTEYKDIQKGLESSIKQTADSINSKVTSTNDKVASIETNLNGVTQRVNSTESTISQLKDQINLKVESTEVDTIVNGAVSKTAKSLDVMYYLSTSATSLAGGSWSTIAPSWINGRYMWSKTVTTFVDGSKKESSPTCIAGATGTTGQGISSITEEYYLSNSKTTQTGGSWVTNPPTWSTGKYMWTRSKIVYKNPTATAYTTPICDSSWEAANVVDGKVTTINNKVASIETNLNGITQRVSSTESTISTHTTQLGTVDNRINTAKNSAISTAASDATTKANNAQNKALADAKSYTNGQITTVTETINSRVAEIKATTDSITQKVSATETTVNSVTTSLNNLQVGGRNYVLKSDAYITGNTNKQFDFSALQELRGKKITVSVEIDLNAAKGSRVGFEPSIIYADGTTQFLGVWQSISTATTAKKRISATHTIQDKEIKSYSQKGIYVQGVTSGTAKIGRPKLEIGTKATDWTPAPEDIDSAITSVDNKVTSTNNKVATIETNINSITSKVSSTESQLSTVNGNITNLQSRINTAEQKITATAILNAVNEQIGNGGAITTTSTKLEKGKFTIYNGALIVQNNKAKDVMWCNTEGWLTAANLYIYGSENPSNLEIGGSGNKGIGIRTPSSSGTVYIDFAARDKNTAHSSQVATGQFHRIASYAGSRETLAIEVGSKLDIRKSSSGAVNMTVQGTLLASGNISTTQNMIATGNVTAGGFKRSDTGYTLIATDTIDTIKYANNNKPYLEVRTPRFGAWGVDIWASDEKIKENIAKIDLKQKIKGDESKQKIGLDLINNINHYSYNYIEECGGEYITCGYVAQELQELNNNLVLEVKQDDGSTILQPSAPNIIPNITLALKQQQDEIEQLKKEIKQLKNMIRA